MYYSIQKKQAYYSTLLTLSMLGIYPTSGTQTAFKTSYFVTYGIIILSLVICNIGALGHLFVSLKGSRGSEISEDMTIAIGGLGFLMSVALFKLRSKKWIHVWQNITNFNDFGKPDDFLRIAARSNFLSLLYSLYIGLGTMFYTFLSYIETDCTNEDEANNFCGTLTQIWLPIGKVSRVTIYIIFFLQMLICIWTCIGAGNLFFVSYEAAEFLVCHLKHLKKRILNIFKHSDEKTRKIELACCVKYHNYIINMGNDLNGLIKFTLGHMSLTAAIVMGMLAVQIVQKYKPLGAVAYLGGYVVAIFWLSLAGQKLTDESLSIADIAFESDWRKGNIEMKRDFIFIIRRSQDPLTINALPLGSFNYALFVTILKAAYSYFTLLQQSVFEIE